MGSHAARELECVMNTRSPGTLILGGAALIIAGSFLPWVQVRTIFGTISANGTDGDGILTLVAGAIIAILGFTSLGRSDRGEAQGLLKFLTLAFLAGVLFVALTDFVNISEQVADKIGGIGPSYGPGLFVVIGGTAVAGVGAFRIPAASEKPLIAAEEAADSVGTDIGNDSSIAGLERLHDLHSSGAISDDEYQRAKDQLLGNG